MTPRILTRAALPALVGQELGTARWLTIDQSRIDMFATATDDRQWIHVDVDRATAERGGTIAHGFLSLSLLSAMALDIWAFEGASEGINYGFDKIRFLTPVPSGGRVRMRQRLAKFDEKPAGILLQFDCTVDLEGGDRPALIAQWLCMMIL